MVRKKWIEELLVSSENCINRSVFALNQKRLQAPSLSESFFFESSKLSCSLIEVKLRTKLNTRLAITLARAQSGKIVGSFSNWDGNGNENATKQWV